MSSMSNQQQQPQPRRKRFIPKYEVEGVHKVTLSEETQAQIEMLIGTHINAQYPWKFVSKAKIMESIDLGGELSEFFSLQKEFEEYTEEEVLMGYIVDESKNTDDFYVCVTIEARDHCKQQSDRFIRRQEKKLEKAVQKKPRPWISLGSEEEILELEPVNKRTLMELEIKAKFPTEYQPDKFTVRDSSDVRDGYIELKPYRQKFNNVFRRRVDCGSQITPALVDRVAQTQLRYPKNMWTQSIADALGQMGDTEGGGDASHIALVEEDYDDDKSSDDEDNVKKPPVDEVGLATYRAAMRRMRRPSYMKMINGFLSSRVSEMESMIELNAVMDMYYNDYPNLVTQKYVDTLGTMTFEEYVCFTDVRAKDKYVSSAVFHPMWSGIVAISYADGSPTVMKTHTTPRQDPIQRAVYGLNPVMIWSHIDSLIPKLYLEAPREVKVLSFCPFNENILVGGLINGQIVIWDLTNKLENVEKIEVLSETREKYRIAMNAHMGWMKTVQDRAVVNCTACSSLMNCHVGPVSAIKWMSPNFLVTPTGKVVPMPEGKTSLQFMSSSIDGGILMWNMSVDNMAFVEGKKVKKSKRVPRRPSGLLVDVSPFKALDRILQPCYKVILGIAGQSWTYSIQSFAITPPSVNYVYIPKNNGTGRKYFNCEILKQTEDDMNDVSYFGTLNGELTRASWEGHEFNTGEAVNSEYSDIKYCCSIHDGVISTTQKNPLIDSVTLTVGGKIFAIWSDKLLGRPIIWKKRPYRLTDGVWSQYKPSILFLTNSEGDLETWDLLLKSDKPISVQTLSGTMLTGVSLHTLPLAKNIIGVSDVNGSFRMFLNPPVFMLGSPNYIGRMEAMIARELKVMKSFITWQENFIKKNPHVLLEIKRKEGALLAEKEEEKRRLREEEGKKREEELEARRLERMKVVGPEERWQKIIQKLIERTIAVKKRINRGLLIEHEKPLRELETQRLEKERRMLEIMKNQKTIFNDTVAILFPEAIKKPHVAKKSLLTDNKETLKKEYMEEFDFIAKSAAKMVKKNPYKVGFRWDATLTEGKERRAALNAQEDFLKMHYYRIEEEFRDSVTGASIGVPKQSADAKTLYEDDEDESVDAED
ncbi:dynein axonemal intermediate chain 3 [Helicoverpa zea]|uniref:dynein axonemal intermediate chain 3 n=1 Tax=Helicoverpa zea TaxID=7113 RepID=UPI001F560BE6|nr:dynein axonemal intermediate chain 3 [Helicoverpa zea]